MSIDASDMTWPPADGWVSIPRRRVWWEPWSWRARYKTIPLRSSVTMTSSGVFNVATQLEDGDAP